MLMVQTAALVGRRAFDAGQGFCRMRDSPLSLLVPGYYIEQSTRVLVGCHLRRKLVEIAKSHEAGSAVFVGPKESAHRADLS